METIQWKALTLSSLAPGWGHLGFPKATNTNPLTVSRAGLRGPRAPKDAWLAVGGGELPSPFLYPHPHHPAAGDSRAGLRPTSDVKLPLGQAPALRRSPLEGCLQVPCSVSSKLAETKGQQSNRLLSSKAAGGWALTHMLNFK